MKKFIIGIVCLTTMCACGESKFQKQSKEVFAQCEAVFNTTNEILDKSQEYEVDMNNKIASYLKDDKYKESDANLFFSAMNEAMGSNSSDSTKHVNKILSEYVSKVQTDVKNKLEKPYDTFLNYKNHEVWSEEGDQTEALSKLYDEIDYYANLNLFTT